MRLTHPNASEYQYLQGVERGGLKSLNPPRWNPCKIRGCRTLGWVKAYFAQNFF